MTLPLVQSLVFGTIQFPLLSHVLVAVRFVEMVFEKHGCVTVCPGCVESQVSWLVRSSEQFPLEKIGANLIIQLRTMYANTFLLTSYEDDSCYVSHIEASSCNTAVITTMTRRNTWICEVDRASTWGSHSFCEDYQYYIDYSSQNMYSYHTLISNSKNLHPH